MATKFGPRFNEISPERTLERRARALAAAKESLERGLAVRPSAAIPMPIVDRMYSKLGRVLSNTERMAMAKRLDGLLPVDFALSMLRDTGAPIEQRQWAAEFAAPYIHAKVPTVSVQHNATMTPTAAAATLAGLSPDALRQIDEALNSSRTVEGDVIDVS